MRMPRLLLIATLTLCLTACSPAKEPKPPEPTSQRVDVLSGVDINAPLSIIGTEPIWNLTLSKEEITLERPGQEPQSFPRQSFEVNKDATGPARAELISNEISLTLIAKKCSDGMSNRAYPLTAEVNISDEVLRGCATSTEALESDKP